MFTSTTDPPLNLRLCRGAMLCVVKSKRKDKHAEALTQDYIITRKFPFRLVPEDAAFRVSGTRGGVDTSWKS